MKTARGVLSYCFGHGRIIDRERYRIATTDLDAKDATIIAQAKEIAALRKIKKKFWGALLGYMSDNDITEIMQQALKGETEHGKD